ncbi:DNA polymerase IV [Lachnospiraceae bacterium ZAX-1]
MEQRLIFHIDVNSAYLSWSAVEKLKQKGTDAVDLRLVPSIIGGDISSRHGVVLAKSIPAKAYRIRTGEPVVHALKKCPTLVLEPPNHRLYEQYSKQLMKLLSRFCPAIEQVSIDECYMDFTDYAPTARHSLPKNDSSSPLSPNGMSQNHEWAIEIASTIKDSVLKTLGFTVNIGISSNKLLAKMASDFEKPNRIHTLFPDEIQRKMWPLPVGELYMAGKSSVAVLAKLDVHTVGDLAKMDVAILTNHLKSHGHLLWKFANGIDDSLVQTEESDLKCIGNSTTLAQNAETSADAKRVLKHLCSQVSSRLKSRGMFAGTISTEIKYATFANVSHQTKLVRATCDEQTLYHTACQLFDELWNNEPIRLLGVRTAKLVTELEPTQLNLFDMPQTLKEIKADKALEQLQEKFGKDMIHKGFS